MLVAAGRGPLVEGIGLEEIGVQFDQRKGIAADEHRRTTVPHIYAVGDCAGYWQLAHTAFREGEVAAENAMGHDAVVDNRGVPRPIYTDPEIAGVGLTEARGARAVRRRRRDRQVPVGRERARDDAGRDRRLGQVDPRDAVRRVARARHGRPARDRPDRGRRGRARRRGDGRDGRRRDGRAPDALRGDQGGGPRRARPRDPHADRSPARPRRPEPEITISLQPRRMAWRLSGDSSAYAHCDPHCVF